MPEPSRDHSSILVRRLESIVVDLTSEERDALASLPIVVREFGRNEDIVREGDRPAFSCLVVSGICVRYKLSREARRQIIAFHLPGDIPDLQSLYLKTMDHSFATVSRSQVGLIGHGHIHDLIRRLPRLGGALWRETLIDAAVFREWVVNLGVRKAPSRLAHLFCEVSLRFEVIGEARDGTIHFPVTQEDIGDALGVSAVHANRALQELRAAGLVTFERGHLTIRDWDRLAELGEFDPGYLHLA